MIEKILIGFLGVIFIYCFNKIFPEPGIKQYVIVFIVLLAILYIFVPLLFQCFVFAKKIWKILCPKIGILNGYIYSSEKEKRCQPVSIKIGNEEWRYALLKALNRMCFKRIRSISVSELDDSFSLIINPFGENYPEQDLELHTTFHNIRQFIARGGIFFCTGCPFFWHQNPITGKDAEWSFVKTVNNYQASTDSLAFIKLGISVTMPNNPSEPTEVEVYQQERDIEICGKILQDKQKVRRFRSVLKSTGGIIPLIRENGDRTYPLCAISYDDGYLIQAGLWIGNDDSDNGVEFCIVVKALANLIRERFKPLK